MEGIEGHIFTFKNARIYMEQCLKLFSSFICMLFCCMLDQSLLIYNCGTI